MTTQNNTKIKKLVKNSSDPKLIEQAFEFAQISYKNKNRLSGENYIHHAVRVALTLDKMGLDPVTVAFGILHDVMDDKRGPAMEIEIKTIENKFGREISQLVEKISELSRIRYSLEANIESDRFLTREKLEQIRRMFMALAGDLRVVLVELVSRLDGLNFINYLSEGKQKLYSLETLQIFVPIASRLGLNELRRSLEDKSFSCLFPEKFNWLKKVIKEEHEEREKYLRKFIPRLKKIFKKERVKIKEINYRTKSYWSTYKKLARHDMDFEKIHDLLALRIITPDVESCYKILGIIHKHFRPISEEINDYIAKPKPNGYRSLHTTIFSSEDKITEIQIRTEQMHKEAEYGICAHWSYKEKINLDKQEEHFNWIKEVRGNKEASEFWNNFKINFFNNRVFAFTPRGDVIELPRGSTAVDFAYAVHSEIGNHCELAKINGKIAPLNHTLENGDIVEITVNKNKNPSKDWLRFVKTSLAKSHIKRLTSEPETGFKLPIPGFIKRTFLGISEAAKKKLGERQALKKQAPRQVYLAGQKGMLITIAKCCNPQPGDKVKAYISKHRAAVLHLRSCENFKKLAEKNPEKVIDASWG